MRNEFYPLARQLQHAILPRKLQNIAITASLEKNNNKYVQRCLCLGRANATYCVDYISEQGVGKSASRLRGCGELNRQNCEQKYK